MKLDITFRHDRANPVWVCVWESDYSKKTKRILIEIFDNDMCRCVHSLDENIYIIYK